MRLLSIFAVLMFVFAAHGEGHSGGAATGANLTLSNLSGITGTITPAVTQGVNFGSTSLPFASLFATTLNLNDGAGNNHGALTLVGATGPDVLLRDNTAAANVTITTAANGAGASGSFTFAPGTASTGIQGQLRLGGHYITTAITTAPSITAQACVSGTPSVAGTDVAGRVTMATTCTSATVTFGQVYATAPVCVATIDATTGLAIGTTTTTSTLVLTATFPTSALIHYICVGY